MKLITNILLLLTCLRLNAQTSPAGTWHSINGNQVFIIKLWHDEGNSYLGHYEMREFNNGVIGNLIFTSRKQNSYGFYFPPTIYGSYYNFKMGGTLCDNTIIGDDDDCKRGAFLMSFTGVLSGCTTCNETASWKVTQPEGLRVGIELPYSIPTDAVLTKVSNTVTFD